MFYVFEKGPISDYDRNEWSSPRTDVWRKKHLILRTNLLNPPVNLIHEPRKFPEFIEKLEPKGSRLTTTNSWEWLLHLCVWGVYFFLFDLEYLLNNHIQQL